MVGNQTININNTMTPLKGTDPKLVSGGAPTRGKIGTPMGNNNPPNTGTNPYSSAPLPKSGKPVGGK
jgi:hypothetical protein